MRDSAMRAGESIINAYCESAIHLMLPQLELGLLHDNWRIRHSSVKLLGDLLFTITGL